MLSAVVGIGLALVRCDGYKVQREQAKGVAFVQIQDMAVNAQPLDNAPKRLFASDEVVEPGVESGVFFVATRVGFARERRGLCVDPGRPCTAGNDCGGSGGRCSAAGFCEEPGWCPEGSPELARYRLDTGDVEFWVKSAVQFESGDPDGLFANSMAATGAGSNVFSLRALLEMCSPPVSFEDVRDEGASLDITALWDCALGSA